MQPTTTPIKATVLKLVEEMVEDWDLGLEDPISLEDKLIEDLSFSSVDFVQLFVSIEKQCQKKIGFHDLLMPDGKYVDDLSIAEITNYVEARMNSVSDIQTEPTATQSPSLAADSSINAAKVAQFRQAIPTAPVAPVKAIKNRPALFILSPSRSGSTLLRIILAGHPQLFAPPELHLLSFATLGQRKKSLSNELNQHLLYGLIRAIMQLKSCSAQEAEDLMAEYESQDMPVGEFYGLLQQWLASNRLLVDKTPSYAYHVNLLRAIESYFDGAIYIHLVRHPYATIRSFEDAKIDRLLPFMQSETFTRREYGELAWLICQQNILEFLQDIPDERQFRLKFEDLVAEPAITVQSICNFLGLDFEPKMLDPYQDQEERMTDGIGKISTMSGDLKFYLHQGVDAKVAERWKQYYQEDFLSDIAWQVAESLGYRK